MFKIKNLLIISIYLLFISLGLFSISFAHQRQGENASSSLEWQQGYTLILMSNTDVASANQARAYVASQGGRIAILSPPHIMLGWVAPELHAQLVGQYGIELITQSPVDLNTLKYKDEQTIALASFFNSVASGESVQEMAASAMVKGEPLINDAFEAPPLDYSNYLKNLQYPSIAPSPGNSDSMTGTVAVCLFFIESNGSIDSDTYTWNSTDQQNTHNRALSGLSWWASQAPSHGASVTFTLYYYPSDHAVTQQGYEPILHSSSDDGLWINKIMENLGYASGDWLTRVRAFNTWLKGWAGTDWAFSVFIGYNPSPAPDRFTNGYFAYAYKGGPYAQLLFRNNGWGEENFGLVLTHETGHIFWACDEYYQAGYGGCTSCGQCNSVRPSFDNGNCEYCNPNAVDCMMRHNSYTLCSYTPLHIGWTAALLSVSLTADPSSGTAPLSTNLTADVSGTAAGTINYTFWWNCNDPSTSVSAVTSICGNPQDSSYGAKFDGVSDDPKVVNHIYTSSGTYTAKVIAERGSAPPAEKRRTITVEGPPLPPTLASPANGATGISISPTLSWNASSGATSYRLQVSTTSGFSSTVIDQSGITGTSRAVSGLSNNTTYYWRVNATNAEGTSAWSSVWSFTTVVAAPSPPTLASPANGATGVSTSPTLSWNTSTGATSYRIQVSSNSSFTSIVFDQGGITGTSRAISGLSNNTIYYWRVNATNAGGTSAWSIVWGFTTVVAPPPPPTLVSPANGATGISTNPTLTWNPSSGATSYRLQVSTTSGFSSTVIDQSGITGTSRAISGLSNNTTYYWRVNATNAGGTSAWSSVWSFTTVAGGGLEVTPSDGLSSSGPQGGPFNPPSKAYTLRNTGGSSINWSASLALNSNWITLSSTSGALAPNATTTVTVSINSNANGLPPSANYSDTLYFTNTTNGNGNTSRVVDVTVYPAGVLMVSPSDGLSSSGPQGGPFNPASKLYTLQNTGGQTLNWTASKTQNWVTLSGTGGTLGAGTSTTITVQVNLQANVLQPGNFIDTVSFTNTTNSNGNTTRSVGLTVTVSPPIPAILVSPFGEITDTTPAYTWNAVSSSTWYYLWVNDSTGTRIQQWYRASEAGCASGTGTCSVASGVSLAGGAAKWWIQTWNTAGYGPWSQSMSFAVLPPPPVTLVSPSGTITTGTPIYTWNAEQDSSWYFLWVNDATGNKIQQWYRASEAGCASGTGTCSVQPSTALVNGAGKWWIQTWSTAGYGPWSQSKSFTVILPGTAILISPSGMITDSTPAYTWNAVPGSTWYYLWVNDSTGNRIQQWYRNSEVGCPSGTGNCSVTPPIELAAGDGKWWIQTWIDNKGGPWSAARSFTLTPPGAATLISPTGTITDTTPTYTWNAVPDVTWYYLWVDDATGNQIQQWYRAADAGCASGTGTCSVTPTTGLAAGAAKWWIETYSPVGYGPWSAGMAFTVSPGGDYIAKYSQDFSSEPGWSTNNPNHFYRDALTQTYYAMTVESADEYSTIPVNWTRNSFKIEFDIKIVSSELASGISIGLFDADRNDSQADVVDVIYGHSSDGLHVNLHTANATTNKSAPASIQPVQHNVWYHHTVTWDKNTGVITLELKERDTETLVGSYTLDGFTSFSSSMVNLGISWVGHNASSNETISYLDNMIFYEKSGP